MMSNQTILHIRIEKELKEQAADILNNMGMDIPTAFRIFINAVVREKKIPFEISALDKRDE